jgi:hypothetical protein
MATRARRAAASKSGRRRLQSFVGRGRCSDSFACDTKTNQLQSYNQTTYFGRLALCGPPPSPPIVVLDVNRIDTNVHSLFY